MSAPTRMPVPRGPARGWRLRRRVRAYVGRAPRLTASELAVRSMAGEDGVLQAILARIGSRSRWFVEFGAASGEEGNCVLLADFYGWSGLFLEADPDAYRALAARYAGRPRIRTVRATVTADNVEALFDRAAVPAALDILSIDIDGNDFWVWKAIERYRPRVVVIEYNASLPLDAELVMPRDDGHRWDATDYFGASLGALRALGAAKGYELVHTDSQGVDAFFVLAEEAGELPRGEQVALHPANYLGQGLRHREDPAHRPFHDLRSGARRDVRRI